MFCFAVYCYASFLGKLSNLLISFTTTIFLEAQLNYNQIDVTDSLPHLLTGRLALSALS